MRANTLISLVCISCFIGGGTYSCFAGEVSHIEPISFGSIDFHPGGDTIQIIANHGPARPGGERSIVSGGKSGFIRIVSENIEHVDILYPSTVTLSDGSNHILLDAISAHSEYGSGGADTLGGWLPLDISVGGRLTLSGNEMDGHYSGSMTIILNYGVPDTEGTE